MKDEYHENAFKRHDEKWGSAEFNWKDLEDNSNRSELIITHPNVKTEKDKIKEIKDFKLSSKKEQHLREQDLDLLFTLLRKHIQTWWD
jgi:hypothetical protein